VPDVDLPDPLAWLIIAGIVALAIYNLWKLLDATGVDRLMGRMVAAAFEPLADMLALRIQTQIDQSTRKIWDQLRPNGGTSLRDGVDRTEVAVERLQRILDDHLEDVEAHASDPTAHIRPTDPDKGPAGPR
jgi:hypothetical protein